MPAFDSEKLRQALLEAEQLRQSEEQARRSAEALLKGLERLSEADSQNDGLLAVISVLPSVADVEAALVLEQSKSGLVTSLAATVGDLCVVNGTANGPLARAFSGKSVVLAETQGTGWCETLGARGLEAYRSALFLPIKTDNLATVLICLASKPALFAKSDIDRMSFLSPLAVQAIRHAKKLAELRAAIVDLDAARTLAETSARTDPLTGLFNRKRIEEKARATLTPESGGCFLLIDLNGFKPINDNYGHQAGDEVLIQVGRRLKQLFEKDGLVARIGGDEFGLILNGMASREDVMDAGWRACEVFSKPVDFDGHALTVGGSIGIAMVEDVGSELEQLMQAADSAMYSIKARRETAYAIYDPKRTPQRKDWITRETLKEAMGAAELRPHFQPQYDLVTGRLVGFEALARWIHAERGLIPPSEFLPAIESEGLHGDFTEHIVRSVLGQMTDWGTETTARPRIAINVADVSLASASALEAVAAILADFPDVRNRLVVEVTESVLQSRSFDQIRRSLVHLVKLGAEISLDDFGTGFVSFDLLRELPFHEFKIDSRFVAGIGVSRSAEAIIEALMSVARGSRARVVAEGVELRSQVDFLRRLDCQVGQGFLFAKPMDASQVHKHLQENTGPVARSRSARSA